MLVNRPLQAILVAALLAANAPSASDRFTPLLAAALTADTRPVPGTDGRLHIVYELILTNSNPTPATPKKVEVLDGSNPSRVLAAYGDRELLARLRTTAHGSVQTPTIDFDSTRIVLIDLSLAATGAIPARLMHRIDLLAAASPSGRPAAPVPLTYSVAPLDLERKLPDIGPPLAGKRWVALNGCCGADGIHRSSSLGVNGKLYFAQRFAIDWMRLDGQGRFFHGDPSDVHNYTAYDAEVMAVADGTVVDAVNDLKDQKPGTLPDPNTITIENVDGNHVVEDLGGGVFALYAHLRTGSARVHRGDRVKRGQVLANLGNTGNTSAPHLHFHLMEGASVLGSNGIPYTIDSFALSGQVGKAESAAAKGMEGDWGKGLLPKPSRRNMQFPLDLNIVDFPPRN